MSSQSVQKRGESKEDVPSTQLQVATSTEGVVGGMIGYNRGRRLMASYWQDYACDDEDNLGCCRD